MSHVTNTAGLFWRARSFNQDLGKWDVSKVVNMDQMFYNAKSFSHTLCGHWRDTTATRVRTFVGSSGSTCPFTTWPPKSKHELKSAIRECLKLSPDCSKGPHGPIGGWDVTRVTLMDDLFYDITEKGKFTGDIGKWDMSKVTDTGNMFKGALAFNSDVKMWNVSQVTNAGGMFQDCTMFNSDIRMWDVSKVTSMDAMFFNAKLFNRILCGHWLKSAANKLHMFKGSAGKIVTCWFQEEPSGCATKCGILGHLLAVVSVGRVDITQHG